MPKGYLFIGTAVELPIIDISIENGKICFLAETYLENGLSLEGRNLFTILDQDLNCVTSNSRIFNLNVSAGLFRYKYEIQIDSVNPNNQVITALF